MAQRNHKRAAFRIVAAALAIFIALFLAEVAARYRERIIRQSDHMDPGLTTFDPVLGWVLASGWQGKHRHYDFQAEYQVNGDGFRFSPSAARDGTRAMPAVEPDPGRRQAANATVVVGDSFTFGLGVNNDQTFCELLNIARDQTGKILNCGVPGYSTDQQLLMIERDLLTLRPPPLKVLLIIYLANDLLDNQFPFPLQAGGAKPWFVLGVDGSLELRNSPVPPARKTGEDAARTLATAVFGGAGPPGQHARSWAWPALSGLLLREQSADHSDLFRTRLAPSVELFGALMRRMKSSCQNAGVSLECAMLPGRSYLEEPRSASAQYQEHYREAAFAKLREASIPTVDLARQLRARVELSKSPSRTGWYYRNDGHLTAAGHRLIAEMLAPRPPDPTELPGR